MKLSMKIILSGLLLLVCYFIVLWSFPIAQRIVTSLTLPTLSVVTGFLIGAVGIFLGSLGNLYGVLKFSNNGNKGNIEQMTKLVEGISVTTKEVKHNVYFVIGALLVMLFIPFLYASDIPYIQWPLQMDWLSKPIVLTSLQLYLSVLVFWAIIDCIGAMFLLHRHYETAITSWIIGNQD